MPSRFPLTRVHNFLEKNVAAIVGFLLVAIVVLAVALVHAEVRTARVAKRANEAAMQAQDAADQIQEQRTEAVSQSCRTQRNLFTHLIITKGSVLALVLNVRRVVPPDAPSYKPLTDSAIFLRHRIDLLHKQKDRYRCPVVAPLDQ